MNECKCALCGHTWKSRVSAPAQCPRCKRYDWKGKLDPCADCDYKKAALAEEVLS
jgi:hypothetical protein